MTPTAEQVTIGVVGLGNLGRAVGLNLLSRGCALVVFDRSPDRQQHLVDRGAVAGTVEALSRCDQLIFAVPDETAIWDVLGAGPGTAADSGGCDSGGGAETPLISRLSADHAVIVLSTILPRASEELATAITAHGARYLEAPVTGGAERAEAGDLTVLLGGSAEDVETLDAVLAMIGSDRHLLGPVGAGSAAKLANQLIMLSVLGGVHEAVRIARAHDVDERALLAAISSGTADTWVGRNWGFFDAVASDYNRAGVPRDQRPWYKDLREVIAAAAEVGVPVPLAGLLSETVGDEVERHARAAETGTER